MKEIEKYMQLVYEEYGSSATEVFEEQIIDSVKQLYEELRRTLDVHEY